MLAPIDKLNQRGGNRIIQIAITRKCDIFTCSNCTQGLPFRRDALEMTLECLEAALDSLQGWPGVVAAFGGNPCTHSKFPEVCRLFQKYIPNQRQRGLWTNNLRGHGKIVRETFWPNGMFNLNVHNDQDAKREMELWLPRIKVWGTTQVEHGMVLGRYQDYGITDVQWKRMREKCDINRNWSGLVREYQGKPVAYFCEVGATIDGIRGENHGIPCDPGWWSWGITAFGEQITGCCDRGCAVPLRAKGHLDRQDVYDISPSMKHVLPDSKAKIKVECHDQLPESTHELTDYIGLRK